MEGKKTLNLETKIGKVQVTEDQLINFKDGLLGFKEYLNYVLLEEDDESIFIWLQSIDSKDIAFPILEMELIGNNSDNFVDINVKHQLNISDSSALSVYSIISIPEQVELMTANIKAPIIINNLNKKAIQHVMPNPDLEIAKPVFKELRKRLASSSNVDSDGVSTYTIMSKRARLHKEKIINS